MMVTSNDFILHNIILQTTSYWPKNFAWGNDFTYNHNSKVAEGFKKSFLFWNSSLSYILPNKAFIIKLKIYDILNQNIGVYRTITPTAIMDQDNTVLSRYGMVSISWKFDKFQSK